MKKTDLKVLASTIIAKRTGHGIAGQTLTYITNRCKNICKRIGIVIGAEIDILDTGELDYSDALPKAWLCYCQYSQPHRIQYNRTLSKSYRKLHKVAYAWNHCAHHRSNHWPTSSAEADYNVIFEAAAKAGVTIEINGQYDDVMPVMLCLKKARKCGCCFAIVWLPRKVPEDMEAVAWRYNACASWLDSRKSVINASQTAFKMVASASKNNTEPP